MNYNIYKCEYKNSIFIKIASDEFIKNQLSLNDRKKSDLEVQLLRDTPHDNNDFKAEIFEYNLHFKTLFDSISFQDTISEDITVFNNKLKNLFFIKASFFNGKLDVKYFSNLYLVRELYINGSSKGKLELDRYSKLLDINILHWNKNIIIIGDNDNYKNLVIWYYNPKSKLLIDLLQDMKNIKHIEFNFTNIEILDGIEQLENLESIKINYGRNLKSVKSLNANKKLVHIFLNNCNKLEDFQKLNNRSDLLIENVRFPD